ncbi:MAG TPA: hypothetical protein VK013_02260 [Myxococcaceae bacterium]|nr:hypothetical protein [Myxococcaceae bacterium]
MTTLTKQQQARLKRRRQRGQAMLEYSIINWVLIVALVLGVTAVKIDPDGSGQPENIIEMFYRAYQTYYDSFYFVLNMPFP